jgi:hypothetical protein
MVNCNSKAGCCFSGGTCQEKYNSLCVTSSEAGKGKSTGWIWGVIGGGIAILVVGAIITAVVILVKKRSVNNPVEGGQGNTFIVMQDGVGGQPAVGFSTTMQPPDQTSIVSADASATAMMSAGGMMHASTAGGMQMPMGVIPMGSMPMGMMPVGAMPMTGMPMGAMPMTGIPMMGMGMGMDMSGMAGMAGMAGIGFTGGMAGIDMATMGATALPGTQVAQPSTDDAPTQL